MAAKTHHDETFHAVLDAYADCALWAEHSDDNDLENAEPSDELENRFANDVRWFLDSLSSGAYQLVRSATERAGHDLWLTRNGHGAGFWDGDWPEPVATELTRWAERLGHCDLYLGDDDLVYAI